LNIGKKIKKDYKMKKPKVGDKIYLDSSFYISHGEDDFVGGLCTINVIEYSEHLKPDHCNYCMIGVAERPGFLQNYKSLIKETQKRIW